MTLEQIQRMPIRALSHEDAMAWLWVPQGLIPEGLEVLKSWGYRYIDEMIWDKYYLGLGRYLRHTHETMLLGIRGKPELKFRAQPSLVRAPRQDHSISRRSFSPSLSGSATRLTWSCFPAAGHFCLPGAMGCLGQRDCF